MSVKVYRSVLAVTLVLSASLCSSVLAQDTHEPVELDFEFIDVNGSLEVYQDHFDYVEIELEDMFEPVTSGFGEISVDADWLIGWDYFDENGNIRNAKLIPVSTLGPVVDGRVTLPAGQIVHLLSSFDKDDNHGGDAANVHIFNNLGTIISHPNAGTDYQALAGSLASRVATMRLNTNTERHDIGFPKHWAEQFGFPVEDLRHYRTGVIDTIRHETFHTLGHSTKAMIQAGLLDDANRYLGEATNAGLRRGLSALLGGRAEGFVNHWRAFVNQELDSVQGHLINTISVEGKPLDWSLWQGDPSTWETIPFEDKNFTRTRNLSLVGYPAGRGGFKRADLIALEELSPIRVKPEVLANAQDPPPPVSRATWKSYFRIVNGILQYLQAGNGLNPADFQMIQSSFGLQSDQGNLTGVINELRTIRKAFAEAKDLWLYNNKPGISIDQVEENFRVYNEWRASNPSGAAPASLFNQEIDGDTGDSGEEPPTMQPGAPDSFFPPQTHGSGYIAIANAGYLADDPGVLNTIRDDAYAGDPSAVALLRFLDQAGLIILKSADYMLVYHGIHPDRPHPLDDLFVGLHPEMPSYFDIHSLLNSSPWGDPFSPWNQNIATRILDFSYVSAGEIIESHWWGNQDPSPNPDLPNPSNLEPRLRDSQGNVIWDPEIIEGGRHGPTFTEDNDNPGWGITRLLVHQLDNGNGGAYWRLELQRPIPTDGLVFVGEVGVEHIFVRRIDQSGEYLEDFHWSYNEESGLTHIDFPGETTWGVAEDYIEEIYIYTSDPSLDLPVPIFKEEAILYYAWGAESAAGFLSEFLSEEGPVAPSLPEIENSTLVSLHDVARSGGSWIISVAPGTAAINGLYLHENNSQWVHVVVEHAGGTSIEGDLPLLFGMLDFADSYTDVTSITVTSNGGAGDAVILLHPQSTTPNPDEPQNDPGDDHRAQLPLTPGSPLELP